MSDGDLTGVTFHTDFMDGWDVNVLQQVHNKCYGRRGQLSGDNFGVQTHR